MQLPVK